MSEPETSHRRDTVLVVDDTPDTLGFLTDMLDGAGFTVLIATDGESALDLLVRVTPDLVLMDALMPGLDGFEVCRRIKRQQTLAQVPVIFMTGLSETEHVVQGLSAGGVDYVTKPIVVEELLARIRVHLANARNAQGYRAALDAAGRFLLATDRGGKLLWSTPKAEELLRDAFGLTGSTGPGFGLPESVTSELLRLRQSGGPYRTRCVIEAGSRRIEFSVLSPIGSNELLFRLSDTTARSDEKVLQEALALTSREGEVLLWLSRGKSNREIGEILGISPRTVNKHLEQVFVKLGVGNRASAAARAVRLLSR